MQKSKYSEIFYIKFKGDKLKIGIPKSLYYYYFCDLWKNFFEYLKIDVVTSPDTTRDILELGFKYSSDEMCLSMKDYIGHVAYLKDKCDYILVPRIDNYGRDNQTCTNFLALYDIVNNTISDKILNYNINLLNKETEEKGLISIGKKLGFNIKQIKKAYKYAKEKEDIIKRNRIINNIGKLNSLKTKVLLVSHAYNIYNNFIGKPIIKMLENLDIQVVYSDLFYTNKEYKKYVDGLYWNYSKNLISSIYKSNDKIDGIIFLSSFPCGIDSLVNELVLRKLDKPYINIIIDDVESLGGIETRIESFIDIISIKK